jgi:hypothetical protein
VQFVIRDMMAAIDRVIIMQDGKVGLGANSNPIASLANTDTLISDSEAVSISPPGLAWRVAALGYAAAFDNTDSNAPSRNGVLIKSASVSSSSLLLRLESGGIRRLNVRGDGRTSNEETNILDPNGLGICGGPGLGGGFSWRVDRSGYAVAFENASVSSNCNGLLVKAAGTAGANVIASFVSGGFDRVTFFDDGQVWLNSNELISDGPGRYLMIGRNSHVGLPGAGAINLVGRAGAANVIWGDSTGTLRIGGSRPTNSTDGGGVVVGLQASRLEAKNILREWDDPFPALQEILKTRIVDFTYKTGAYNGTQFTGPIADWSPVFSMDGGSVFNPISAFGYTVEAIKALYTLIQELTATA